MNNSTPRSSSHKVAAAPAPTEVNITLPTRWGEVEEPLLVYILKLIAAGFSFDDIRAYVVLRRVPREFRHRLPTSQLAAAAATLSFLAAPPDAPIRPAKIGRAVAIDAELHDVPFSEYLIIENLWQGFVDTAESVTTSDGSSREVTAALTDIPALAALLPILYTDYDKRRREPWHDVAVIYWVQGLKALFARTFPNLFRPATAAAPTDHIDMRVVMETQIRALTDGDVTKRNAVLEADTWAALTELDAKAREAETIKNQK